MFDLHADDVGGAEAEKVQRHGICMCGHRVAKHRTGWCLGVPTGRMVLERTVAESSCACAEVRPVLLTPDARKFQLSWKTAFPSHPLTASLRRAALEEVEVEWLVSEDEVRCEAPGCGSKIGVRPVYQPGTFRKVSVWACQECVPVANGI